MVKDWSYLAQFKRKDLPSLQAMAERIRQTHDTEMIENINQRFDDKATNLQNGVEIVGVTKTEDLMVNDGINQCIALILGTGSSRWRYMAYGHPGSTASVSETTLDNEYGRIDMSLQGWREAAGMKLFFGAILGETTGTNQITEIGVFTNSSGGQMLNHEIFSSNPLVRSGSRHVFILSVVVEFCPVAD